MLRQLLLQARDRLFRAKMDYHCKPLVCLLLVSIMTTAATGTLISGPQPVTAVAPVGAMVTFTCVVNTTELPAGTKLVGIGTDGVISWIVNGMVCSQSVTENGTLLIGTHQLPVIQDYLTSVLVQCRIIVEGSFSVFRSNNATLTAYGPPEAPSNLTSTQSSTGNALILSWSAPSSLVQLHYTVTVNTSTTTITVTNDTTITITREQVMAAINSTECDIYTFSITATNPAGSSIPANLTTPVTFVPAPDVTVSTSTNGSTLNIIVALQSSTDFSNNVSVELVNLCADELSYTNKIPLVGNDSWSFNTDPEDWTSITVVVENQCRSVSVPVNFTALVCPNTGTVATTTPTETSLTATGTSLVPTATPSSDFSLSTVVGLSLGIVTAYLLGLGTASAITVIVWLCVRKRSGAASDKNNPPVTTANEAYGVHSLPASMDQKTLSSAAPVYERIDTECVK